LRWRVSRYDVRVILDALINRATYCGLGERVRCALDFLASPKAAALEPASSNGESTRFDIRGDDVFALVQRYRTKLPADTFWEAHRKYIDVQCLVESAEMMGWLPLSATRIVRPYDDAKDFVKVAPCRSDGANQVQVSAGMFAIFYPNDAHMPGLAMNGLSAPVKKIVVKVRV
jgi:biofilm protein TabA